LSIAAMNWALAQELESCQQQVLLYVIGDSADPNGVTRHCDPDYMASKARLSRATMFRRLGELEDLALLSRRKYYTEEGAPRYEIRLNLEAHVSLPIRSRKSGDDEGGTDGGTEPEAAATETPKSQAETLVRPESHASEPTKVSPVRQAQSHSCDYISPPLSKSLPPNPPPGGSLSRKEAEVSEKREALWQRFLGSYPGIAAMDQQVARQDFDGIDLNDAEWAVSVAPAYATECVKLRKPPKNAHLWLRKGMFKNFPRAKIEAPPPDDVWIVEGSDADRALRFVRFLAKVPVPFIRTGGVEGARGYPHKTEVGPDLLAMLAFVNDTRLHWTGYPRGSENFGAWQARFQAWIGQRLPTEPGTDCIRVPGPWPPSKEGVTYTDDDATANQTANEEPDHA
jgi:hypothetical protein